MLHRMRSKTVHLGHARVCDDPDRSDSCARSLTRPTPRRCRFDRRNRRRRALRSRDRASRRGLRRSGSRRAPRSAIAMPSRACVAFGDSRALRRPTARSPSGFSSARNLDRLTHRTRGRDREMPRRCSSNGGRSSRPDSAPDFAASLSFLGELQRGLALDPTAADDVLDARRRGGRARTARGVEHLERHEDNLARAQHFVLVEHERGLEVVEDTEHERRGRTGSQAAATGPIEMDEHAADRIAALATGGQGRRQCCARIVVVRTRRGKQPLEVQSRLTPLADEVGVEAWAGIRASASAMRHRTASRIPQARRSVTSASPAACAGSAARIDRNQPRRMFFKLFFA